MLNGLKLNVVPWSLRSFAWKLLTTLADKEDNCDSQSNEDEDSVCEMSDDDSIPPLTYDSSDDGSDDDGDNLNEGKLFPGDSIMSSLPSLASPSDSDTESDNNLDSDGHLAEEMDADDMRCCGMCCSRAWKLMLTPMLDDRCFHSLLNALVLI